MAIQYKAFLEKKIQEDKAPLTTEELGFISEVEAHIDEEIIKQMSTDNTKVNIFLHYVNFTTKIGCKNVGGYPKMTSARKNLLFKTLMNKYENGGWKYEIEYDDSDSMFSGSDYLILKGKKN